MFINNTHLPQLLGPEHYSSSKQYEREVEPLFLPGWHCVAAKCDIPRDGDYVTIDVLHRPLIVWRRDGAYYAFLNVCAHRFCQRTCMKHGNLGPHLTCQYHGWEFHTLGRARKIPAQEAFDRWPRADWS